MKGLKVSWNVKCMNDIDNSWYGYNSPPLLATVIYSLEQIRVTIILPCQIISMLLILGWNGVAEAALKTTHAPLHLTQSHFGETSSVEI